MRVRSQQAMVKTDYRQFRLCKLNTPEFSHIKLLRPEVFARDNALTRAVAWFYTFDTNTNVCPSLHVIGSAAALFVLRDCPRLRKTSVASSIDTRCAVRSAGVCAMDGQGGVVGEGIKEGRGLLTRF